MAEDQYQGNWWDTPRSRFESASSSTSSTTTTATTALHSGTYGWLTESSVDITAASSRLDSVSATSTTATTAGGGLMIHHNPDALQIMGLGLSSQGLDWNQPAGNMLRQEKPETSFRTMLEEGMNSTTSLIQQEPGFLTSQLHWKDKLLSNNEDQQEFSQNCSSNMDSRATYQAGFQLDNSSSLYGSLQGLMGSSEQPQQMHYGGANYQQHNYFGLGSSHNEILGSNLSSNKVPHQFLRPAPVAKSTMDLGVNPHGQVQFGTNNAPFWNAPPLTDARPGFFTSLQSQLAMPSFDEKPKNTLEVRDTTSTVKKSGGEATSKRPRSDTASSTLPPFKVRKEKMGDRITALQQLVSPFGKTDTASVLSEAIEYIKFLHEQVSVLSTPYLKSGASFQHQQGNDKSKQDPEGHKQDLRSRGLCLVPVSSTFPVTHDSTVDFWTPTYGGSFR